MDQSKVLMMSRLKFQDKTLIAQILIAKTSMSDLEILKMEFMLKVVRQQMEKSKLRFLNTQSQMFFQLKLLLMDKIIQLTIKLMGSLILIS